MKTVSKASIADKLGDGFFCSVFMTNSPIDWAFRAITFQQESAAPNKHTLAATSTPVTE
jgi:hypothetical protein